jgi:hypothetical protein
MTKQNINKLSAGDKAMATFSGKLAKSKAPHFSAVGTPGGPARRDLTHRRYGDGDAGAAATEKRADAEYNKGGKTKMFGEQAANPRVEGGEGITGKRDVRGPGGHFAEGGSLLREVGGGAAKQKPSRTGGSVGIDAAKSLKAGA